MLTKDDNGKVDWNACKMADLLAFYNAHADKSVKRFADRNAAVRRCKTLLEDSEIEERLLGGVSEKSAKAPKKSAAKKAAALPALPAPCPKVRADAIRQSWANPETHAKRRQRSNVKVDGVEYRSVRQAFVELGLELKDHISFRMILKREGKLTEHGMEWEIIPLNYS